MGLRDIPPAVSLSGLGTWRSPVAHLNGVQGVAGSNPAVPTQSVRGRRFTTADLQSAAKLIRPSRLSRSEKRKQDCTLARRARQRLRSCRAFRVVGRPGWGRGVRLLTAVSEPMPSAPGGGARSRFAPLAHSGVFCLPRWGWPPGGDPHPGGTPRSDGGVCVFSGRRPPTGLFLPRPLPRPRCL